MSTTDVPTASAHQPPPRGRDHLWRSRWAAIGAAVAVVLGGGTLHFATASSGDASSIVSITPTRILDTRDPVDLGLPGPFVSAVGQDLRITGPVPTPTGTQTVVPDGATGVLLNVTVVQATAAGFISVRPAGTPGPPETSSLNFDAGDITPNAVFVALPTDGPDAGRIEITYDAFGTPGPVTDILGDVVGYTMGNPDVYTRAEADARFLTQETPVQNVYMARVDPTGVVRSSSPGIIAAERLGTGLYAVEVERHVSSCGLQATIGLWNHSLAVVPPIDGVVAVTPAAEGPSIVGILTMDTDGNLADRPFHLQVTCNRLLELVVP